MRVVVFDGAVVIDRVTLVDDGVDTVTTELADVVRLSVVLGGG